MRALSDNFFYTIKILISKKDLDRFWCTKRDIYCLGSYPSALTKKLLK